MWRIALALWLGLMLAACRDARLSTNSVLDAELAGGDLVRTSIPENGPAILLLYDPEACFSCDGVLARWTDYSRAVGIPLYLVVSRQPLEVQRLQLMAYRVEILGVLRQTPEIPAADAYMLSGDGALEVTHSALGVPAQAALLDSLEWSTIN